MSGGLWAIETVLGAGSAKQNADKKNLQPTVHINVISEINKTE